MTLRQRLVLVVLLSIVSILLLAGSLVLSSQQRSENFTRLTAALDADRARSDVAVCIEDLHQQLSIQSQLLPIDPSSGGLDTATRSGILGRLRDCRADLAAMEAAPLRNQAEALEGKVSALLDVWEAVTENLGGARHSEGIQLLALRADPAARILMNEGLVQARLDNTAEIDAAREEFLRTAETGDALLVGVGVLVLVTIASSLALMLNLNRGVTALLGGAERFKQGELEFIIQGTGGGELDDVASQMNEMAVAIVEARGQLQERAERLEESLRNLQKAQAALVEQAKMAALGNLVAGISHEVNTPLGVAVTATSYVGETLAELDALLTSGKASRRAVQGLMDSATEGCDLSARSLERASELMQSFKQIAVDRTRSEDRTLQTSDWVGTVLQSLKPLARKHAVEVVLRTSTSMPVTVAAGALEQVLTNLVVNSFNHAFPPPDERPPSSPEPLVEVRLDEAPDGLRIQVSDNGQGMPPEVQQSVFDPFFTTKRGQGGTGLGMHIVHQIVTGLFNGGITLATPPEGGVRWDIRLPFGSEALRRVETT